MLQQDDVQFQGSHLNDHSNNRQQVDLPGDKPRVLWHENNVINAIVVDIVKSLWKFRLLKHVQMWGSTSQFLKNLQPLNYDQHM